LDKLPAASLVAFLQAVLDTSAHAPSTRHSLVFVH
jgi:hypothetical protein